MPYLVAPAALVASLLSLAAQAQPGGSDQPAGANRITRQEAHFIDAFSNRVAPGPLPPISEEARRLHGTLTIADLHADTLLWDRDLLVRSARGHVDLPRLIAGHVALQVFASVTQTAQDQNYVSNTGDTDEIARLVVAQEQPARTFRSLLERSLWHAEKLRDAQRRSRGSIRIVGSVSDLDALLRARAAGKSEIGALLAVEGLHNLEGRLENVDRLYRAGFRMAAPVHFFDNGLGGSAHGVDKGGLTPFGTQVIRAMERRRMIVDVAHASPTLLRQILSMTTRPVVSSHGGVQATCPGERNLSDEEIRLIARGGGLIGIGYWRGAVCDISPAAIAAAMAHVRNLVGIRHVALGSDFDGSTETAFDASALAQVTQALLRHGFSPAEIRKVMGENLIEFLRQQLPA